MVLIHLKKKQWRGKVLRHHASERLHQLCGEHLLGCICERLRQLCRRQVLGFDELYLLQQLRFGLLLCTSRHCMQKVSSF